MMRRETERTKNLTAFSTLMMMMTLILIEKGGVVLLVTMTQIWTVMMKREGEFC